MTIPPLANASNKLEPTDDHAVLNFRMTQVGKLMRTKEVLELTGMCRSTLYNMLKKEAFVRPIAFGERSIRFLETEVHAWIKQRMDARGENING